MNNNFTSKWWDTFMEETANMTKTTVFKDCMSAEDTSELRNNLMNIIQTLCTMRTSRYGFRVYENGKILDKEEMLRIYDSKPNDNEDIHKWVSRVFGDNKFGIIINQGERFNLDMSKNIALKTNPLLKKVGYPREGVNFSLFIGNYEKTPLGIHLDSPGESVLHFHLGPGDKTMYVWEDNEEYERLAGEIKTNNHDIEPLIPYAKKHTFSEGDLYFMPQGKYHVGVQNGLSMAITFWFYNHNNSRFADKLYDVIREQYFIDSDELLSPDLNDIKSLKGAEETLKLFNLPDDLKNLNYVDLMKEAYLDLRYSVNSNSGYRKSPFERKEELDLSKNDQFIMEDPYEILYRDSIKKDKLYIYIRGVKIQFKNFECIKRAIDEINKGNKMSVGEFLGILDDEWADDIGLYILSLFHKHHAIRVL